MIWTHPVDVHLLKKRDDAVQGGEELAYFEPACVKLQHWSIIKGRVLDDSAPSTADA